MDVYRARDQYGCWTGLQFGGTGLFRLEDTDGCWWLVTPAGIDETIRKQGATSWYTESRTGDTKSFCG